MKTILIFLLLMSICCGTVPAGVDPRDPPVLTAPVSGRSTAVGNAAYCLADEALRYNPAFLSAIAASNVSGTYGILQQGSRFGSVCGLFRAGGAGIGIGISDIRTDFERYTGPDTSGAGTLSVSQTLFSVAAGIKGGSDNLFIGAAARMLSDGIGGEVNNNYLVDAGAGYVFSERLNAGLVVRSVTSSAGGQEESPEPGTVLAIAWHPGEKLASGSKSFKNTVYAAVTGIPGRTGISLGWERILYRIFTARLGYDRNYPAGGVGLRLSPAEIDIAAALKEQGLIYFMTFGWRFESAGNGDGLPAKADERKAVSPSAGRSHAPVSAEEYVRDGWSLLRVNKLDAAAEKFDKALALEPSNSSAAYGRRMVEKEKEKTRKKGAVRECILRGYEALENSDYVKADASFRAALRLDPDSREANEGIRITVESVCIEIEENFKKAANISIAPVEIGLKDSLALSESGSFGSFVSALRHLAAENYRQACAEWRGVKPADGAVARKYRDAFIALPAREYEQSFKTAAALAERGCYYEAVQRLERNLNIDGLEAAVAEKTKGLIAAYEYVGRSVGKTNIAEAKRFIQNREYGRAAICLERVMKAGYEVEEARKLRQTLPPVPDGGRTFPQDKNANKAPPPKPPTTTPASPGGSAGEKQGVEERIKAQLLKEYRTKAAQLYEQGRIGECREYLLRILYLDPGDAAAKRSLEKVNEKIKSLSK